MKVSEAILKGMERFPKQAFGQYQKGNDAACVLGCANWALTGHADDHNFRYSDIFRREYSVSPSELNDLHHFPRDVIAGMFAAIGE